MRLVKPRAVGTKLKPLMLEQGRRRYSYRSALFSENMADIDIRKAKVRSKVMERPSDAANLTRSTMTDLRIHVWYFHAVTFARAYNVFWNIGSER